MKGLWSDVWLGLRCAPARSLLAWISLAAGWFALTILLAIGEALHRQAQTLVAAFGADSLVLLAPAENEVGPPAQLGSRHHAEFVRANLRDAAEVSAVQVRPPDAPGDFSVVWTDEYLPRARRWRISAGRFWDGWDVQHHARAAVATADLARRHGWRVGDPIAVAGELYRLTGICDTRGDPAPGIPPSAVFLPHTAAGADRDKDRPAARRVEAIYFRARSPGSPEALRRRVERLLEPWTPDMGEWQWVTLDTLLAGVRRWQRAIRWTAGVGGALSLLLGGVTLAGMLLTSVRERVAEIGLRRAFGAQPSQVAGLFLAEAAALTTAAAATGMLAAGVLLAGVQRSFPLPFEFGWRPVAFPLALAALLAVICSAGPAWQAARLPPAEALRNE